MLLSNLPDFPPRDNAAFGVNAHQSRSLSFADRVAYQRAIEDITGAIASGQRGVVIPSRRSTR